MSVDNRAWICQEIFRDMERDVAKFDGMPLDGRTVAEIHAALAASIAALARVVESLLLLRCRRCDQEKPLDEFTHNGKGRFRPYCKPCSADEVRAIAAAHSVRTAEQIAADRVRLRPDGRKRCARCHESLTFDAFANSRFSPDGLQGWCRECNKGYRRGGAR